MIILLGSAIRHGGEGKDRKRPLMRLTSEEQSHCAGKPKAEQRLVVVAVTVVAAEKKLCWRKRT